MFKLFVLHVCTITDYHQKCLRKVFEKQSSAGKETEVTVVLAEHLLGKLAQGDSYSIDNKMKLKGPCQCGCGKVPLFNSTGIGNQSKLNIMLFWICNFLVVSHLLAIKSILEDGQVLDYIYAPPSKKTEMFLPFMHQKVHS